jgi:hypothetical protein
MAVVIRPCRPDEGPALRLGERGARCVSALVEHDHPWAVGFQDSLYEPDPRMIRYVRKVDSTRRPS